MERQMKNLRSDLQTSNKELAERDLQLSQLRKCAYYRKKFYFYFILLLYFNYNILCL